MSNTTSGLRGFNFRPAKVAAQDCFFMQKVSQFFGAEFTGLEATIVLDATGVSLPQPYTFLSARNLSAMATVYPITQIVEPGAARAIIPEIPPLPINTFRMPVEVPSEVTFTDATGTQYTRRGRLSLALIIQTTLTYDELTDSGIPNVIVPFMSTSGTAVNGNRFNVTINGNADVMFLCPELLRMNYEGECSFMAPAGERLLVEAQPPITP